jgi:hypothetical protein
MRGPEQGRVRYARRRPADRPRCPHCAAPYRAGSTLRAVTYYYPTCRCLVPNRKCLRRIAGVTY